MWRWKRSRHGTAKNHNTSPVENWKANIIIFCGFLERKNMLNQLALIIYIFARSMLVVSAILSRRPTKIYHPKKPIYSEGTLLGQPNQLVYLFFGDRDEKHLDRIPREKTSSECCCHEGFFGSGSAYHRILLSRLASNSTKTPFVSHDVKKRFMNIWFTHVKIYTYPKHVGSIPQWRLLVTCHFAAFSPSPLTLANIHPPCKQWYIKRQLLRVKDLQK